MAADFWLGDFKRFRQLTYAQLALVFDQQQGRQAQVVGHGLEHSHRVVVRRFQASLFLMNQGEQADTLPDLFQRQGKGGAPVGLGRVRKVPGNLLGTGRYIGALLGRFFTQGDHVIPVLALQLRQRLAVKPVHRNTGFLQHL